jgi:hypothetical protein
MKRKDDIGTSGVSEKRGKKYHEWGVFGKHDEQSLGLFARKEDAEKIRKLMRKSSTGDEYEVEKVEFD